MRSADMESFKSFDYNDIRISQSLKGYQLSKDSDNFCEAPVSELDKVVKSWFESNDINEYKSFFLRYKIISEEDFKDFYKEDHFDRECKFCEIKESEILDLRDKGLIQTKRLSNRGVKMEVDRLEPNNGYIKGNIVTCCYWCNNAKTDEFSAEEFNPIGKLIGQVLKKRLMK